MEIGSSELYELRRLFAEVVCIRNLLRQGGNASTKLTALPASPTVQQVIDGNTERFSNLLANIERGDSSARRAFYGNT